MKREITMDSVFNAGFKAAWLAFQECTGDPTPKAEGAGYFRERQLAWLDYVKELEDAK